MFPNKINDKVMDQSKEQSLLDSITLTLPTLDDRSSNNPDADPDSEACHSFL